MLHNLLSSLIERVIGSYVEDVNSEKLSIGLLNGDLALSNINLKKDTLHRLFDLPFVLERGSVGRILVHIPYTHLWSQPWKLYIENVDLVAYLSASDLKKRPSDDEVTSGQDAMGSPDSQAKEKAADVLSQLDDYSGVCVPEQRVYLEQMEQKWWQTVHQTGVNDATALAAAVAMDSTSNKSSWWSYVASPCYNVVRNIQVEIHNVYLRIVPTTSVNLPKSPNFGAFMIGMDHLTMKAADLATQKDVESKLIEMDGLCVTWLQDLEKSTDTMHPTKSTQIATLSELNTTPPKNVFYVLPPIRLCGSLERTKAQFDHSARITFRTTLSQLRVQLSCGFCRAAIQLSEFTTDQHRRLEQFDRRPKVPLRHSPKKWWKYAVGEIRPHLRSLFSSHTRIELMRTHLRSLAAEAHTNLIYVRAYSAHLLRGLTTVHDQHSLPSDSSSGTLEDTISGGAADEAIRLQCDAQWPLWRIAVLRLVAMRQAAAKLHRNVVKASRSRTTSRTDSPASNVLPDSPVRSVASPASAISWYAWWRYSSWLGGTSSWWSSSVATVPDSSSSLGDVSAESARFAQTRISDQVTAQPVPTVKDAVFELLDELATASEHLDTDRSEAIPTTTPTTIASFRLVCQVEGCSIRLTDVDSPFPLLSEAYVHPAFISISGQQMQFTLEMRPWDRTARFAAGVQSFTVCDERYHTSVNSASSPGNNRPLFPSVIFPQLCLPTSRMRTFFRTLSVPCHSSVSDPSSPSSGLFWLVYEVAPSGDASEYSLEIKTDPLHVVYQPELIKCVMDFFRSVASAASPTLETSARHQYEVIKERTQANIRAMFDDTTVSPQLSTDEADVTPNSDTTTHDSSASIVYSSLSRSRSFRSESGGNRFRPRRWRINLDIAAPRLLLPANPERGRPRSAKDLVGLLCDFGHFRVTNWPSHTEKQTTGLIRLSKSMSNVSQSPANEDENELFLTPCGTPEVQSEDEENVSGGNEVIQKNRSKAQYSTKTKDLYESYVIHLEDLHVLVGKLCELEKLGLWTNSEISEDHDESESGSCVDSSADIMTFHLGTPRLSNRLCLVDRLSLRLLVSRRLIPFSNPQSRCHPRLPESYCPPTFWFTFEQERCVVQLSDSKVYNLLRCLQATTTATTVLQSTGTPDLPTACAQAPAEQQFLSTPVAPSSLDYQEQNKSEHPFRPDMFSLRRKRFIASFRVQELVLQLENKGYPVAECRLEGAAGTLIRLTGRGGAYQGRLLVHSLSVADALTNLGEEYDLLVASNQNFRLKEWSIWSEPHTNEVKQSVECDVPPKEKDGFSPGPLGDPPEGHMVPITEFTGPEPPNGSQRDLMQIYFDWIPTCHSLDKTTRPSSGSRTVHVNMNSLDVVYNPETVSEVYSLLHHLSSLVNLFPASEPRPPVPAPHSPSKTVVVNLKLCLEHLSVMLIDICPQTTQPNINPDVKEPNATRRVERLLLATIGQLSFGMQSVASLPAYTCRTASIHLRSVHVSNMYDSSSFLRYLLTSTFTSAKPSTALDDPVLTIRICWSASPPDTPQFPSQIYGCLGRLTYVHDEQMVSRLISYLTTILPLNCDNSQPGSQFNLPLYSSHRTQFRLEFFTPALFFPDPSSLHVLIARATLIRITNSHLPLCNSESEASSALTIRFHWENVECVHVNLTQLVPIRAVTQAEQIKWFYIHRDNLHEFFGSGVDPVLEPTSGTLWVSIFGSGTNHEFFPKWFTSSCLSTTTTDMSATDPVKPASAGMFVECRLHLPVHLTLNKLVCAHLSRVVHQLRTICSLQLRVPQSVREEVDPTSEIRWVENFGLYAYVPYIQVSLMADLDLIPVPLARLQTASFAVCVSLPQRGQEMHFSVFASRCVLFNLLPPDEMKFIGAPTVDTNSVDRILLWASQSSSWDPSSLVLSKCDNSCFLEHNCEQAVGVACSDDDLHSVKVLVCHECEHEKEQLRNMVAHSEQSVVRIRAVLPWIADPQIIDNLYDRTASVRFATTHLLFRLDPQPWVLIMDFCNLFAGRVEAVHRVQSPQMTTVGSNSTAVITQINAEIGSLHLIVTHSGSNAKVGNSEDDSSHCDKDLAMALCDNLTVHIVDRILNWKQCLPVERQRTPENLLGTCCLVEGSMSNLTISALSCRENLLYAQRVRLKDRSADHSSDSVRFHLLLSCLPDQDRPREGEDAYLWIRLDPVQYVHTQSFLTGILDTLNGFVQNYDLMARARASSEGLQLPTLAPNSLRILLDLCVDSPTLIVPVSATSPECLVAMMHRLQMYNSFFWVTDDPCYPGLTREFERKNQSDDLEASCASCVKHTQYMHRHPQQPKTTEHQSTGSHSHGKSLIERLSDDATNECLYDQITLDLQDTVVYHAKFVEDAKPLVQCLSTSLDVIRFSGYRICPCPGPNSVSPYLFDSRPVSFSVGRNLSSALSHVVPDWRLTSRWNEITFRLTARIYSVIRGILSHNFSGSDYPVQLSNPDLPVWMKRLQQPVQTSQAPVVYPPRPTIQTSVTGVVWTMITFWFDLQNVQITFYPEPVAVQSHSLPALAPCTQINLTCARFSFDKLSNHRSWMELVCSRCSLVNLRSPDSSLSKPTALQPLFEIRTPLIESTGHSDFSDIKPSGHLRLTYISSTHSSLFMLHASKTNLVFDPVQLSKFVNLIGSDPASSDPDDVSHPPPDEDQSPTKTSSQIVVKPPNVRVTETQICLHDSELVLCEKLEQPHANRVVLHGTCNLLRSSRSTSAPSITTTRAVGCLHHLAVNCLDGQKELATLVASLTSARADLVPMVHSIKPPVTSSAASMVSSWRSSTPSVQSTARPQTPPHVPTNAVFRSALPALTAVSTYSGSRLASSMSAIIQPDRLVLSCQTTTLRVILTRKTYDILLSVIMAVSVQLTQLDSVNAPDDDRPSKREFLSPDLDFPEHNLPPDVTPPSNVDPLSKAVQCLRWPESISRAISADLHILEFNTRLVLSLFETAADGLIPLFELRADQLNLSWRQIPAQSGMIVCSGLAINYFNRDLICWEPAMEPWSCSLEWNPTVNNGFSKITNLFFSSPDPLNLNLTVPLISLIRLLCESPPPTRSDVADELNDDSTKLNSDAQNQLRLSNQTGSVIWYRLAQPNSLTATMEPNSDSVHSVSSLWQMVPANSDPVDIPCADCFSTVTGAESMIKQPHPDKSEAGRSNRKESIVSHSSHRLPRLAIQVAGWKASYSISVDRPGVFFRTLERQEALEIDSDDFAWAVQSNLPSHTRLVIEVVRSGSLQHLVILRSGLTITNYLPDGHTLCVALQLTPVVTEHEINATDNVWASQLILLESTSLTTSVDHRIPLLSIQSGQTSPVPLNLAAVASTGLGFLCFCPVAQIVPVTTATPLLRRPVSGRTDPRGIGGTYSWASVHMPYSMPERSMDSSPGDSNMDGRKAGMNHLMQLDLEEAARLLDWTRLKLSGELVEVILMSHASVSAGQSGLLGISAIDRAEPNSDAARVPPTPVAISSLLHESAAPHAALDGRRSTAVKPYYMCLALVRDNFPPDPLWVGLPSSSVSDLIHPRQLPGHHLTVGPTVRITNLLPYEMTYFFAGTSLSGDVPVGDSACVFELSPMAVLSFGVRLEGFPKCEPLPIPPNTYNEKVLIRLYDTLGRMLELQVQVLSRAGGPRHLTVSAVIWLVNESGLPLVFAQSATSILSQTHSKMHKSLAGIAAGQYEEHEQARSVTPLLFCFAKKNEGHLLRVRVGRGARSKPAQKDVTRFSGEKSDSEQTALYPVWSPGISLDKPGVDMLQLKIVDRSNRPDEVYHIGFDVRPGRGRHSVTTVVTFKPRYMLDNQSGLKLQVGQLRCTKTRSGDRAFVTLSDDSSQAFHWPREDLDRLLCVRACSDSTEDDETPIVGGSSVFTLWSGGFQIDRPYATTLMLRLIPHSQPPGRLHGLVGSTGSVDRIFLRVVIVLRAATFYVVLRDANNLPPPFRLENASLIALSYQQVINSADNDSDGIRSRRSRVHTTDRQSNRTSFSDLTDPGDRSSPKLSLQSAAVQGHTSVHPEIVLPPNRNQSPESDPNMWTGRPTCSYLGPETTAPYALDEPHLPAALILSVQGGLSSVYDMNQVGFGKTLIYDNFIYLTVFGPLSDSWTESARRDSLSCDLVFDVVPGSQRVIYSSKIPGRRAQLWWLSNLGHIYHEGSSSPLEPGERSSTSRSRRSNRAFVLDMDIKGTTTSMSGSHHVGDHILSAVDQETVRQFEIVQLVVAPLNKKRKLYQTWHIDQNGLLVNDAKFCVHIVRTNPASFETGRCDLNEFVGTAALAAKPRPSATHLISSTISPAIIAPLWLRPGSGCLRVFLYLDGVTRVLRIEDAADPSSLLDPSDLSATANAPEQLNPARWGNPLFIERFWKRSNATTPWLNRQLSNSSLNVAPHFKALIALPCGIGVSVISAFAEELIYASLLNIHMSFSRVPAPDTRASDSGLDYSGGLKGLNLASDVLLQHGSSTETKGMNAGETNPSGSETSSVRSPAESTEWDFGFTDFRSVTSRGYLAESVELIVGHIQVDSQFPGAMFPVLLFTDHFDSENPISPPQHQQQQYKPQQQQQKFSAPDQRSSTSARRSAQIGRTVSSSSNSLSWRPTLVARFEREVQTRWNVYLFKRMRIRISPIVIEAEELLLLKLIQFWQHVTDPITKMGLANPATDESIYPRSNTGSVVDNGALFWFDRFSVSPIIIRLSVQTAKNSLTSSNLAGAKRLLPSLMSFTNADVQLGAVDRVHALESLSCLLEQLNSHYHMQLMANAVHIFGSVDFLGNPIGFINDLTSGISGLVDLDVGSLIRHVAHGVGDSTAKVLGSVSQILNAISLDEKHQHERAAILGIRSDTVPLWSSSRNSSANPSSQATGSGSASVSHRQGTGAVGTRVIEMGTESTTQSGLADESLEDFELTRRASKYTGHDSSCTAAQPSWVGDTDNTSPLDIDQTAIAPLTAGFRGFMHGLVGGMTSIVTQPYRGIQEDQFKGFVVGVGRGLLGTFTKPLGGIFDLFSGAMSTLSEVARSSGHGRPRRRRPRRSGLSKYALVPLRVYRLDEAVAQLQLHQLTLFTSVRHSLNSAVGIKHRAGTSAGLVEIGEEVSVEGESSNTTHDASTTATMNIIPSTDSTSGIIQATVDVAWLSHTFHYPECVFHVLPVQETGVVAIITDRAIWCVSNQSLRSWVTSKRSPTSSKSLSANRTHPPTFYLTEHATLMFMLPYQRLDDVTVRTGSCSTASTTCSQSTSAPVYVVFTGDGGVSMQQLRCDTLPWGLDLSAKIREAQFRYIQAAFSLFRSETAAGVPYSGQLEAASSRLRRAPLLPGHPMALSYPPVTSLGVKRLL